jgi:hypothetical protein
MHQAHAASNVGKIWLTARSAPQVIYVALGLYGYYILGTDFDFEQVFTAQKACTQYLHGMMR